MKTLQFSVHINASPDKAWDAMLGDASYREWTAAFGTGSHYVGDWQEGSKILFLAPDENGVMSGMVSTIVENRPHTFLSMRHLGEVRDNVEDTESPEARAWSGAMESYTFQPDGDGTTVSVSVDTIEELAPDFEDMWPRALAKLKEVAER
jgi:hypothetical protein